MLEICMCRHGETNQNKLKKIQGQKDFPLNENGEMQALSLGKYLRNYDSRFDVLISSPLKRAVSTARILNEESKMNLDLIIDDAFIERAFGTAEGLDVSKEIFKDILVDNTDVYEGLETSKEIQLRVKARVLELEKEYDGKRILIVSHSHTIKALVTYADSSHTFADKLSNCALCYFEVSDGNINLVRYNVETIGC